MPKDNRRLRVFVKHVVNPVLRHLTGSSRGPFALFQSTVDPASGKRTEHLELDPTTGQPIMHHMMVVLLRVPPQAQGANAPMGGTGWLINTYALDAMTPPAIATTPTL